MPLQNHLTELERKHRALEREMQVPLPPVRWTI